MLLRFRKECQGFEDVPACSVCCKMSDASKLMNSNLHIHARVGLVMSGCEAHTQLKVV